MAYVTRSDNLEFNEVQLAAQIELLERIYNEMNLSKSRYIDYVTNQLAPSWTTDSGKVAVEDLRRFAEIDITNFITYIEQRINDLREALQGVKRINQA